MSGQARNGKTRSRASTKKASGESTSNIITASGCIFLALDTGRVCMQLRSRKSSHRGTWSFWGGKAEQKERPVETLLRELNEEIGMLPDFEKIYPLHKFTSADKKFEYNAFVVTVFEEFTPDTNGESAGYAWVNLRMYPRPLHQGAKLVLTNPDMIEKIETIWESKRGANDLPNWLDSF
jgi:8-oxo-dGTP pyrophosphatase MutT (NUDIX family)